MPYKGYFCRLQLLTIFEPLSGEGNPCEAVPSNPHIYRDRYHLCQIVHFWGVTNQRKLDQIGQIRALCAANLQDHTKKIRN